MANSHTNLGNLFTNIANAIREKTGETGSIVADDFPDAIAAIPSGSSVAIGQTTITAKSTSITIPNIIGKDNVVLVYIDSMTVPTSTTTDQGVTSVIICGGYNFYSILYYIDGSYVGDDGFVAYDKATGRFYFDGGRYKEIFLAGNYMYIAW